MWFLNFAFVAKKLFAEISKRNFEQETKETERAALLGIYSRYDYFFGRQGWFLIFFLIFFYYFAFLHLRVFSYFVSYDLDQLIKFEVFSSRFCFCFIYLSYICILYLFYFQFCFSFFISILVSLFFLHFFLLSLFLFLHFTLNQYQCYAKI